MLSFIHPSAHIMIILSSVYMIVGLYPAFYYVATVVCERLNISRTYHQLFDRALRYLGSPQPMVAIDAARFHIRPCYRHF